MGHQTADNLRRMAHWDAAHAHRQAARAWLRLEKDGKFTYSDNEFARCEDLGAHAFELSWKTDTPVTDEDFIEELKRGTVEMHIAIEEHHTKEATK